MLNSKNTCLLLVAMSLALCCSVPSPAAPKRPAKAPAKTQPKAQSNSPQVIEAQALIDKGDYDAGIQKLRSAFAMDHSPRTFQLLSQGLYTAASKHSDPQKGLEYICFLNVINPPYPNALQLLEDKLKALGHNPADADDLLKMADTDVPIQVKGVLLWRASAVSTDPEVKAKVEAKMKELGPKMQAP